MTDEQTLPIIIKDVTMGPDDVSALHRYVARTKSFGPVVTFFVAASVALAIIITGIIAALLFKEELVMYQIVTSLTLATLFYCIGYPILQAAYTRKLDGEQAIMYGMRDYIFDEKGVRAVHKLVDSFVAWPGVNTLTLHKSHIFILMGATGYAIPISQLPRDMDANALIAQFDSLRQQAMGDVHP